MSQRLECWHVRYVTPSLAAIVVLASDWLEGVWLVKRENEEEMQTDNSGLACGGSQTKAKES